MHRIRYWAWIAAPLLIGTAHAASFEFKDWAIACDNTRHCAAVGYQAEDAQSAPVLLHLQRDAGPAAPVHATFMVTDEDAAAVGALTVRVGHFVLKGIRSEHELTVSQTTSLLPQLLNASAATLTDGKSTWQLSLAGLKASLLKMDDLQGRVGTPGALVRRGRAPETSVLPARPAPMLLPVPIAAQRETDDKLALPILRALQHDDCDEESPHSALRAATVWRLSSTQVLVLRECSRAAYQSGYAAWSANDKPPFQPRRVQFPEEDGTTSDEVTRADFSDGVMTSFAKGRGLGDCGSQTRWLWTNAGFKLLEAGVSPLCRGFPGGGVMLSTWRARIGGE